MARKSPVARFILYLIKVYQNGISPRLTPSCRYYPSCSSYAAEAVEKFGAGRGGWLAARRLLRCHPLGGEGYDPVPHKIDQHKEMDPADPALGGRDREVGDCALTG